MRTVWLRVRFRRERLADALTELGWFQASGRGDTGNLAFHWAQVRDDPQSFVLFEQWDSQESLDAHLRPELVARWDAMRTWFDGEPVAVELNGLDDLLRAPSDEEALEFATRWFRQLNEHVPVEQLLPLLAEPGLRMRFPERLIEDAGQFAEWYDGVGQAFRDQVHLLESFETEPVGTGLRVRLTVRWEATRVADGGRVDDRAQQTWTLGRSPLTGGVVIRNYEVESLTEITR